MQPAAGTDDLGQFASAARVRSAVRAATARPASLGLTWRRRGSTS
jgi:hypothetical protein